MQNLLIDDFDKLDCGYLAVCDAVAKTLGAEGKLAILENLNIHLPPDITKDGVSVAQRIRFKDKFNNFGALQAISAAARTLEKSGDSTTTCLVFAQGFLRGIERHNFNKGVERGINIAVKEVSDNIKILSKPVDKDVLTKIAITSANNDKELGGKIIKAYDIVGYDGIIEVKKDYQRTSVDVVSNKGMKIEKGYSSPFFINNNNKACWEAEDVMVVSLEAWQYDDNIETFIRANRLKDNGELQPILFYMEKDNGDFKQTLIDLTEAGHINCCLVVAPDGHSELKNVTHLRDAALFSDGTSYRPNDGKTIEIVPGHADKVVVDSEKTYIIKKEIPKEVSKKVRELKKMEKDKEFNKERIQRLEGVSCTIYVGGNSTNDVNEIYDRVDDAISSVKSAIPLGYIAGGGSSLVFISSHMDTRLSNKDEQLGYNLVKNVIREPFHQILKNANRKEPTNFQKNILGRKSYIEESQEEYGYGYNAKTDRISNLIDDGVIDSAHSIITALESAKESSIKMLLTAVIVTI